MEKDISKIESIKKMLFDNNNYGFDLNLTEQNELIFSLNGEHLLSCKEEDLDNEKILKRSLDLLSSYVLEDNFNYLAKESVNPNTFNKNLSSGKDLFFESIKRKFINMMLTDSVSEILKSNDLLNPEHYNKVINKITALHYLNFDFKFNNDKKIDEINIQHESLSNNHLYKIKSASDLDVFFNDFIKENFEEKILKNKDKQEKNLKNKYQEKYLPNKDQEKIFPNEKYLKNNKYKKKI